MATGFLLVALLVMPDNRYLFWTAPTKFAEEELCHGFAMGRWPDGVKVHSYECIPTASIPRRKK